MQVGDVGVSGSKIDIFSFVPSVERARCVEAKVRAGLADSLESAFKSLVGCGVPPSDDLVARVRAGPVAPGVFGAYTDLVEAIFADEIEAAVRIAEELCVPGFGHFDDLRIVTLRDADLGEGQAARYRRLVDEDQTSGAGLQALKPAAFASVCDLVNEAVALLDAAAPEVAGEFRSLVREIVLVETPEGVPFGGASSFQLWGALFLKTDPNVNRVKIAESLAHETAHALLFGLGMGKPLVENPVEARYPSPIRRDQRPMDGVVHATYVIARMYYAMKRLIESELLNDTETRVALEAMERRRCHYARGLPVIVDHARWTPEGEAAFAAARAYMSRVQ